jgi:hypothetical protein
MDTIGGVEVPTDLGTSKVLRFLDIPPATRSLEGVLAPPGLRTARKHRIRLQAVQRPVLVEFLVPVGVAFRDDRRSQSKLLCVNPFPIESRDRAFASVTFGDRPAPT